MKQGIFTVVIILLLIAALIVGGVFLFRSLNQNGGEEPSHPSGNSVPSANNGDPTPTPTPTPTPPPHVHTFSEQMAVDEYLASPATCRTPATYYYLCSCGEVGTTTYTYGPLGAHDMENGTCTICGRAESTGLIFTPNTYDQTDPNAVRTCTLSGFGTCADTDLVIPDLSPDGMLVTRIATSAFEGHASLERVTFPAHLYEIDLYAFKNASALHSLLFSKAGKLQTIRAGAFTGCNALETVTLPEGLRTLGAEAFMYCQSLNSVTLPKTLEVASKYAFAECPRLESVTISEGVTKIAEGSFAYDPLLTSITLPTSLKTIEADAFDSTGVAKVHIPVNVDSIHHDAFYNCRELAAFTVDEQNATYKAIDGILYRKSNNEMVIFPPAKRVTTLAIPEGTTTIYEDSFSEVQGISHITLPASVTKIENGAFYYSTLESITIPAGSKLTEIGEAAFAGCHNLKSITIPAGVTKIAYNAFANCTALAEVSLPYGITTIDALAFSGCTSLTRIDIPTSVTKIEYSAFQWSGLVSITIPRSVLEIEGSVFYECKNLAEINVASDNPNYKSMDGVLYSKDGKTLYTYPAGKPDKHFVIPSGVEDVGSFDYCTALESVFIPLSVKSSGSFTHCENLKHVNYAEGYVNEWGGVHGFEDCINLTDIVLPDGAVQIYSHAFKGCYSLTSVTIPDSIMIIDYRVFAGCSSLRSIKFTGTKAQWEAIEKNAEWDVNMGVTYTIHCTDGDITKTSPSVLY